MADPWGEFRDATPNDGLASLTGRGVVVTNGYRTPADVQRLRRQGYTPAANGAHNRGDAVDLAPGKTGLSLSALASLAQSQLGPNAHAAVHNGTHVHVSIPGWAGAPDTTRKNAWDEFADVKGAPRAKAIKPAPMTTSLAPTGQVHDGDTFRLSNGSNGRLFGVDAFELQQQGRNRSGALVPVGVNARNALTPFAMPGSSVAPTGSFTYGRPVVSLSRDGQDAGFSLLRNGNALAAPNYLKGSPLFPKYMDAERLARVNRLGAFSTNAETPDQFRHKDGPWKAAEPGKYGENAEAVFWDEPTPFQGLRPEVEKGYLAIWQDLKSKPEDLLAYAKANGFQIGEAETRKQFAKRNRAGGGGSDIPYGEAPRVLTDLGDGALGSGLRGLADPINMLDELGGIPDALGVPTFGGPRENVFNSDRRFGDILWNNIDQNRAILGFDEDRHGTARLGGQIAGGLVMPAFGVEGVAARATAKAIERGVVPFAAEQVGKRALTRRLATIGTAEGALAGAGAGEGGIVDRAPGAALGAVAGLAGGTALSLAGEHVISPLVRRGVSAYQKRRGRGMFAPDLVRNLADDAVAEAVPVVNDGMQQAGPTPAARSQPQGGSGRYVGVMADDVERHYPEAVVTRPDGMKVVDYSKLPPEVVQDIANRAAETGQQPFGRSAAMEMEPGADLVGMPRQPDRIDVWSEFKDVPRVGPAMEPTLGNVRRIGEAASPEDMAAAARRVGPDDVIGRPDNTVQSLDDALAANPGTLRDLEAPDELAELGVRRIPSRNNGRPSFIRGPLDLTQSLRMMGGVKDAGGDLRHLGIDGSPRRMDFGSNEQFLGKLVDNENGMDLDEAARALWEEGYFPEMRERPTPADLLERLHAESLGAQRYFHPDDFEEVANFHAARAQRSTIEQAADEGAPLVDDIGEPVSMADLDASAPAIAYEDLHSVGGKAANIDLSKLDSAEDIRRALDHTEKAFGGFDAARRGVQSHAETAALADELGMSANDLLKRRPGQALNAEQALAARRIVAKSAEELVGLAKRAKGGSEADLVAFRRALLRHAAIQEQVTGATAEAGRALQQFKMTASAKDHSERIMAALIETSGGRDNLEEAAQAILDLQKVPGSLNKFARDSAKPSWKDKAVELWYNSLLSGPRTHAVNIISNLMTSALQIPEHATAAVIGQLRHGSADRVMLSELGPRVVGLMQGAEEGLRAFKYTLKTGNVPDHVTKVEAAQQEAIGGLKGKLIRVPTRLLSAEDEFFKAVARRSELAALAVRKARGEGLRGDKLMARIQELTDNPDGEMVEQALDYARYLTFQRPLGPLGQDVQRATQRTPVLKLFLPFVRTPTNLLKFALERSPAAPLLKEVRAEFNAGGAARDLAIARITLGTGVGMLAASWAASGVLTGGGPADDNAKRLLRADGWQPYSIKIGDRYVSYQRLDPLSTTLGVAADFVDLQSAMTDKQREDVSMLVVASLIQNLANKTWASGASDLAEAISDPQRHGASYVRRLAGSLTIPTASSQLAQTMDPSLREARSILDAVKARIPGVSQSLLPRRDVWGNAVEREGGVGPDIVSPFATSTRRNDPVTREALASGARISMPQRGDYSDRDYNELVRIAGGLHHQAMERRIAQPSWQRLTPAQRAKIFDHEKTSARKHAKALLFGGGEHSFAEFADHRGVSAPANDPWSEFEDVRGIEGGRSKEDLHRRRSAQVRPGD